MCVCWIYCEQMMCIILLIKHNCVRYSNYTPGLDPRNQINVKNFMYPFSSSVPWMWKLLILNGGPSSHLALTSPSLFIPFPYLTFLSCSLLFSCWVVPSSLWPGGLQLPCRLPCPLPPLGVCSDSCPLSWWCRPTISSSAPRFSSCLQSFPASGPFPVSQLFASGGQSVGVSTSTSALPMNIQCWFPLGLTGLIALQSKGLSRFSLALQFEIINFCSYMYFFFFLPYTCLLALMGWERSEGTCMK